MMLQDLLFRCVQAPQFVLECLTTRGVSTVPVLFGGATTVGRLPLHMHSAAACVACSRAVEALSHRLQRVLAGTIAGQGLFVHMCQRSLSCTRNDELPLICRSWWVRSILGPLYPSWLPICQASDRPESPP